MRRAGPATGACLSMLMWVAGVVPSGAQEGAVPDARADVPQAVPGPTPTPAPPLIPGPGAHVVPDDKRRTLRSYGHNLVHDFVAVVQRDNHKPLLITAALTAPSFALDHTFEQYFQDHPYDSFGRIGANLGGGLAVAGLTVGLFSAGRISRGDNFRAASYDLSQAVIITQVYTEALKLAIPAYAFGTFVAVSRMAAGKHFFSDIVAGSGLGVSVGRVVVRRNGRPPDSKPGDPPPGKTTWNIAPWAGPSGDGQGLALVVGF